VSGTPGPGNLYRADRAGPILSSFRRRIGRDLIAPSADPGEAARRLWEAPFVVLSHDGAADPVLTYGNRTALELWQTDWATLTAMPSRLTAEPMHREERARFMARTAAEGCVTGYAGIRIAVTGRRFRIEDAIIWNLDRPGDGDTPSAGPAGQAATFARWTYL
jgi:hypothetical protein